MGKRKSALGVTDAAQMGSWLTDLEREVHMDESAGVVTAKLRFGTFVAIGTARKHPADAWSPLVGEWLAVARAMRRLSKKLTSATNELVAAADIDPLKGHPYVSVAVVKNGKVRFSTDNLLGVKDDPYQLSHRLVDMNERLDSFLHPKVPK